MNDPVRTAVGAAAWQATEESVEDTLTAVNEAAKAAASNETPSALRTAAERMRDAVMNSTKLVSRQRVYALTDGAVWIAASASVIHAATTNEIDAAVGEEPP